jgi:Circadian oscillating protein COP23
MKSAFFQKLTATVLLAVGTATALTLPSRAQNNNGAIFYCGTSNGEPATIVKTREGDVPMMIWDTKVFGRNYPPEMRCQIVSERFQQYYEHGLLDFIKTERIRGYDTVCVARSEGGSCEGRILFTLPPGQDPNNAIEAVFNFSGPYRNNCGVSKVGGKVYIKVDSFIQNVKNPSCHNKAS